MSDPFTHIKKKYVATFTQKQKDLEIAWENKDIPQVNALLHKLAGSSGGYGFDQLYDLSHKAMLLTDKKAIFNFEKIENCLQHIYNILKNANIAR